MNVTLSEPKFDQLDPDFRRSITRNLCATKLYGKEYSAYFVSLTMCSPLERFKPFCGPLQKPVRLPKMLRFYP